MESKLSLILFNNVSQAVQISQMIFNEMGYPVDYLILVVNHAFETHIGLKREEIMGKRIKEILPDFDQEWLLRYGVSVKTGKTARFEMYDPVFNKYFDVQVIPLGLEDKFRIIFQDITELKNREQSEKKAIEALRESEKLAVERSRELEALYQINRSLVESITDCFFTLDKELRFTYVNKATEEISGLSGNELLGRKIEDVFPGLIDISLSYFRKALEEQAPQQYEIFSKVVQRWVDMTVYPTPNGIAVYFRDINERAKIKEALQESNIALEKAIAMKDEFLTLMSHELRTPLTVIISAIQLLKTLSWDELPDKAKGYFDTIRKNSNRQLKLVNNILDITRINAGRYDVSLSNTDIVSLTNSIIESIKPYAERKKINIKFSFAPAKMIIGTDQEKYERILLNLLSNAIKYTNKEGSIAIKLNQKIVDNRAMACIQVCDNGIGIPPDKYEYIFERFGQVDNTFSRQAEGTGIGLHLTKMFVELLGGEIKIASKVGKGSVFTVLLPAATVNETHTEKMELDTTDDRIVRLTEVEFSDIYFGKER